MEGPARSSVGELVGGIPLPPPNVDCPENFCHPLPLAVRLRLSDVGMPIAGEPGLNVVTVPLYCSDRMDSAAAGGGSCAQGSVITRCATIVVVTSVVFAVFEASSWPMTGDACPPVEAE